MTCDRIPWMTQEGGGEMSELVRDPAIKLFGRTISLPESSDSPDDDAVMEEHGGEREKDACEEVKIGEADSTPDNPKEVDCSEANATSDTNDGHDEADHQDCAMNVIATADPKPEQDHTEAGASGQEKILKKPDKILPCPRCNSMDTKFCYYNNYNVNQPRYFCKNCQRYWTAGGTMRNVPVGAGRRKNKHSASHYHHIMMSSDGTPSPRVDLPASSHGPVLPCKLSTPTRPLKENGAVSKFGSEAPLCESMANVLSLGDQKSKTELCPMGYGENGGKSSHVASGKVSDCDENELSEKGVQVEQNCIPGSLTPMHPLQCYPSPPCPPWTYPWNPVWNNGAAMAAGQCVPELVYTQENCSPNPIPWNPPPMIAAPAFCAPAIPYPFIPASYWGGISSWANGTWTIPWVGPNSSLSPSSSTSNSGCSGNSSPTLGKHSRDVSMQVEEKAEKSLWVPKTLRIDDPDEAVKSSIWATLGIKPDQNEPGAKGGIFKAFQPKKDKKVDQSDATQVLHANPAALSRSQTFHEST